MQVREQRNRGEGVADWGLEESIKTIVGAMYLKNFYYVQVAEGND